MRAQQWASFCAVTAFIALACGSRSDMDAGYEGAGGSLPGNGGSTAGRPNAGMPSFGARPGGGGPSFAGGGSFAGFPGVGGFQSRGGTTNGAGFSSMAGKSSFGGVPSSGGVPSFGGVAGSGGVPSFGGMLNRGGAGGSVGTGGGKAIGGFGGAAGGPPAGSCCTPHGSPGCSNRSIEACVCGADSFCCTSSWDAQCVRGVLELGCGTCRGGGSGGSSSGGAPPMAQGGSAAPIAPCATLFPARCASCVCMQCTASVSACRTEPGCAPILSCILRTGCEGLACYLSDTCGRIIDAAGGLFAPATQRVLEVANCVASSACDCN